MSEEMKKITVEIPQKTVEILEKSAKVKEMDLQVFIRFLLNEWAMRSELLTKISR